MTSDDAHDAADRWQAWYGTHGERELRCILMTAWDPVGSGGIAEAWDEYDDYLLGVAHRLRDAQDPDIAEQALREYVARVEHNWMGMQPTKRADSARASLAEALVAWYEWSWRRGGRPPREWIDDD